MNNKNKPMSKNKHFYSLTKILFTTTLLVGTTFPTTAHTANIDQTKQAISINDYKEILASPCDKNRHLPQCK